MKKKTACMIVAVLMLLGGCGRSPQESPPVETTTVTVPDETLEQRFLLRSRSL